MDIDNIKRFSIATKGLIFYNDTFLAIKRSEKSFDDASSWEVPGGTMEIGETVEDCLLREIKEEVGLSVEIKRYLYSWKIPRNETHETVGLTFLCTSSSDAVGLSHEHTSYAWIVPSEIHKYNFSEGIKKDFSKVDWKYLQYILKTHEKVIKEG
jgi:8-oxo-dGTP diphosphatase